MKTQTPTTPTALSAIEKAVAKHEKLLADREAKEAAAKKKLADEQAAERERLRPQIEAAASLRNRFSDAQSRRDELAIKIRRGDFLLDYQKAKLARLDELIESNFGHHGPSGDNPDCAAAMWTLPNAREERFAELIIPRLVKWLAARRADFSEVEKELAKLADEAK